MERNLKNQNHIYRLDKFKVPAAARGEFLARVRTSNEILRAIPGFVEDCLLERLGASGDSKIVTIAVWENEQAFSSAKTIVQEHYKKIGFNPIEVINRLGVEADMDAYTKLEILLPSSAAVRLDGAEAGDMNSTLGRFIKQPR